MKNVKNIIAAVVVTAWFGVCGVFAANVELSITKKYDSKISMAVPKADTSEIAKSVKQGLARSGFFAFTSSQANVDRTWMENPSSTPAYGAWKTLGVEILVVLQQETSGEMVSVTASVFHVSQRNRIFSSKYKNKITHKDDLAAFITDDIVRRLTGEQGIENSRIAYSALTKKGIKELFVTYPGGRDNKQVTFNNSISIQPAWMDNGKELLYTTYLKGYPNLFFLNLSTGQQKRFVHFPGLNAQSAVSPDGTKAAFVLSKDGNPEIYVLDIETKKLTRVTRTKAVESSPTWSPDGSSLAFVSDRTGGPQIYIQDLNGTRAKRVSFNLSNYCTSPDWSPKGNKIALSARIGNRYQICLIDLKTKNNVQLTTDNYNFEAPSFSPGATHLVVTQSKHYVPSLKILSVADRQIYPLNVKGKDPVGASWAKYSK